jgi:hypothetical protein
MTERIKDSDAARQLCAEEVDHTDNVLFGGVWGRPQLSKRDRSLVTVLPAGRPYIRARRGWQRAASRGATSQRGSENLRNCTKSQGAQSFDSRASSTKAFLSSPSMPARKPSR